MMGELKKSTNKEKALVQEINSFLNQLYSAPLNEQRIILNTIISLTNQLKIINNSIPAFVHNLGQGVNVEKQRPVSVKLNGKRKKLVHINGELVKKRVGKAEKRLKKRPEEKQKEVGGVLGNRIMILAADKKRFLKELNIAESEIKRLKKMKKKKKPKDENIFKKPRIYAKLSNRFFFKISNKLVDEGNFERVGLSMKKANMTFLLNTYVAMMLFYYLSYFYSLNSLLVFLF